MTEHMLLLTSGLDRVAGIVARPDAAGRARIDDDSVAYRLGRAVARAEVAGSTAEKFGRVAIAQALRELTPDLMDVLGTAGALPVGTEGAADAADDGGIEYLFRLASPTGIYGGTLEVFRNMIAQHELGLGRPNYSPTRAS
jgi:alkylation response protein AidB-like acyl-CoA dehydrogenase